MLHLDIKKAHKNPVGERAVQELEEAIQRHDFHNAIISESNLAIITARLNSKIRSNGLSSQEVFTHRDQFSHHQIPFEDKQLIENLPSPLIWTPSLVIFSRFYPPTLLFGSPVY